jgi:hypothetical protein
MIDWNRLRNRINIKRNYERRYGPGTHTWSWLGLLKWALGRGDGR